MKPVIFVLLVLIGGEVMADDIHFEVGAANASYDWTGARYARLSFRFNEDKWGLGMAHVEEQDFNTCGYPACRIQTGRQLFIDVTRYVKIGRYGEIGVGPSVLQNPTRITPAYLNFHISIGLRYKRATFSIHHYSNAGTSPTGFNMGQDAVTVGWAF